MRKRLLAIAVMCMLMGDLLAPTLSGWPGDVRAQGTPGGDEAAGALDIQNGLDLGNGGQPDGAPREILIDDARFLFDRNVPTSPDLTEVAVVGDVRALTSEQDAPYDAIYLSLPGLGDSVVARYLPERLESADIACPAEAADFERVDAGGTLYGFAGIESDLPDDALQQVGDNNGDPVFADAGTEQPFPELFFTDPSGLLRFVILGDDGRPASLADSLAFAGAQFAFQADATDQVDPNTLANVGCSGPFPVFAPADTTDGTFTDLYVLAGTRLFQFTGEGVPVEAASPTSAPIEAATPSPVAPVEAASPTAAATPPPVVPTEAASPTAVPTDVPTATPTATATPTETPTEAPTQAVVPTTAPVLPAPASPPAPTPTEAPVATVVPASPASPRAAPTEAPATAAPLPEEAVAAGLPPQVTVQNNTYVFTQVNVDIDITTLVQVQVVTVQNVQLTVYAEQNVQVNQAPPLYIVGSNGQVIGQYIVVATTQPAPTAQIEPPAVAPTLAANLPPPAASTAVPSTTCSGDPGAINARGVPSHLPNRIQLGGVAYAFITGEAPDAVGKLTRIGCVGPFEAASTDRAEQSQVIYLRATGSGEASQQVYRFEVALTYQIQFQVTGRPQVISTQDQRYQVRQVWQPSIHSSTSVILFVQDPANPAPDVIYAVDVSQTVVGDVIGEYRLPGETTQPSAEMVTAAEQTGLNPDLTIDGQLYLLVNVYYPTGTTSNGFMTLFSTTREGTAEMLLGRDKRRLELFIFVNDAPAPTGG